ncbi:phytoene desaturase family protein [Leptospira idonii]|uniref:NAD(P)/FAD-dependent oxidoreductase n=1 Tax=Leptospira idonii TaxID=1193500 RepID=A0A4R9M753_9LEPT|nr:NAD(P)/FAD-dependent oxidoreductase [Leptospira idonii]TGN20949.1 NAD(P)/FAD-dependent oxidoreductase [Leptospira idonii]
MKNEIINDHFDIICIGSGMGSLTVASLLSRYAGKKILVIEKHFQVGGYTHAFARKQNKFHWDVGIHYVGDMHSGGFSRLLMDKITDKKVVWNKMPEPFEKFVYPNRTFELFGSEEKFKSDLISQFPSEEESIHQYFKDLHKASALFGKSMMMKSTTPELSAFTAQMESSEIVTLKDYLDHHFKNEDIKAILASQWGDYGLPPSKCLFATHAALVVHYFNGGFYPVGGGGKIFESVEPIILENGGAVLDTTEVLSVIIENGKAIGVKTKFLRGEKQERDYFAPVIVSCAGAYPTYMKLIPESVPIPFRKSLSEFYNKEKMATSVCVYMGLSDSPAKLGFKGENYWIFASNDHEENFKRRNEWLENFGEVKNLYMSFPSLKDPDAKNHTADMIAFTDYSLFEKWKDLPWKKRGEEYETFKKKIAESVVDTIEMRFPGFKNIVEYIEVSTPLTNEHFTSHPHGAIYGLACVPERYDKTKSPWFDVTTPIEGLFLTGVDAGGSPGIAGAMMGGLATTLKILGSRDILKKILKE